MQAEREPSSLLRILQGILATVSGDWLYSMQQLIIVRCVVQDRLRDAGEVAMECVV